MNSKFYVEVLKRLKRRVQRIRLDTADNWKLHHDNVRAHSAFIVTDYLIKAGVPTIPQPPYSPDLAPPDFFLFPRLKTPLKVEAFWDSGWDQSSLHRSIKGHSGGGLPQRIRELEVSLEPMYWRKRRLFWRFLNTCNSKFKKLFLMALLTLPSGLHQDRPCIIVVTTRVSNQTSTRTAILGGTELEPIFSVCGWNRTDLEKKKENS